MSEYEEVAFAELLSERLRNGVYKPKEFHGRGIRVVNMKELFAYDRIEDQPELRVDLTEAEMRRFALQPDDLLFARRSFVLEGAGKCSIVGEPSEPLVFESSMIRARVDKQRADPVFLYYFFRSPLGRGLMSTIATRTAVSGITGKDLAQLRLPLPSLDVQRRTSRLLSDFDALIENNRRRVEVLEEMARAIYREWFVHFRYPGHEDIPLVESPLGLIPEGWEVRPFSELASFVNGFAFKPAHWGDSGRPIIKIKQLKQGVTPDTPRCDPETIASKYWVEPGDLLFSWSADLGVYRWSGEPGLLNQHLFLVKPNERTTVDYLYHALDRAIPQFWDRAQGTTMRHIKRSALSEVTTVVPPRELVSQFSEVVGPIDSEASGLGQESRSLAGLRDLLLPKLVTGQIDVSRLDLDEMVEEAVSA